jgi:cystathionine gamma-synthase
MGGVVDAHAAYLLLRGMKTLELRVERHNRSTMEIARRLSEHKKVSTWRSPHRRCEGPA